MSDERKGMGQAEEARRRAEEDYAEIVAGRSEVKNAAAVAATIKKDDFETLVMMAFGRAQ